MENSFAFMYQHHMRKSRKIIPINGITLVIMQIRTSLKMYKNEQ